MTSVRPSRANKARLALLPFGVVLLLAIPAAYSAPRTLFWETQHLAKLRHSSKTAPPRVQESLSQVRNHADAALARGPYTVIDKGLLPPSGDKHDYLSYSRYWWPNPDTSNGLPYVRRDGEVNRDLLSQGDRVRIGQFYDDVESLTLAAYLLDDAECGQHARKLIRVWFLDPATRMNPNLNYGQGVPGRAHGRAVGIIDTRHFIRVLDCHALLTDIGILEDQETEQLQGWFRQYLDWMLTSALGRKERSATNNHGAWFAAQAVRIAMFVGDTDIARELIQEVTSTRLPNCFAEDGSQPSELGRTRSLHYSLFNLAALSVVARLAENYDLEVHQSSDIHGLLMKRGIDFLAPHLLDPAGWPHPEMGEFALSDHDRQTLLLAHRWYKEPGLVEIAKTAPRRHDQPCYCWLLFESGHDSAE